MIHSFLDYTIYRTPKADRQIQKIVKQYPTFQSVFKKTLKSFLAFPDTRQSWIKQLNKNTYSIRIGTGSCGKRGGLRSVIFTIRENQELYIVGIDKRYQEKDLNRLYEPSIIENIVHQSIQDKTRMEDPLFKR